MSCTFCPDLGLVENVREPSDERGHANQGAWDGSQTPHEQESGRNNLCNKVIIKQQKQSIDYDFRVKTPKSLIKIGVRSGMIGFLHPTTSSRSRGTGANGETSTSEEPSSPEGSGRSHTEGRGFH